MDKIKVFISTSSFGEQDPAPIKALTDAGFEVTLNPFNKKLTKEEALRLFPGHDGLIAGLETLDEEVLSKTGLKVISRCGAGVSNVDLDAARRLNVQICSTPDAPTLAVAELTIGVLLALLRNIPQMDRDLHEGQWRKRTGHQLAGKTVVIVGFGRIGRKVAEFLGPFQVEIIVVDPLVKHEDGVLCLSLHEALPKADIVTLHVSGGSELIGFKEIALMKKGVFILNAARGGVINEDALAQSLKADKVAGVWCDVFGQEPYQGPLREFARVILTPHIGSYTAECRKAMEMQAAMQLIGAFDRSGSHA